MSNFVTALVVVLLHYNESSSAFTIRFPLIRDRTTNSQLHWSCLVECNDLDYCEEEGGTSFSSTTPSVITTAEHNTYDLTSPREWLEFCELENGNGAYTVMRCDYDFHDALFLQWGNEFHLNRLESSFATIAPANVDLASHGTREKSRNMIRFLLKQAKEECQGLQAHIDEESLFCTFMVTILWQPKNDDVQVQGHIFSSLTPADVKSSLLSNPLTAAIALDPYLELPNRCQNSPDAKLIAWCRKRRPLEEKFKSRGVGEVLLTRKRDNQVEILEGLTSNLFVLYPGGVLHTCETDSVLKGYARHLVITAANACGLTIAIGPILTEEADLWQEVFLTSSIRVIAPVGEIILPDTDGSSTTLWRLDGVSPQDATDSLMWKQLLSEIYEIVRRKGQGCFGSSLNPTGQRY
ncbi:unnamed protein product [Cylindrotheca closterium]|uniref:Uncharacterized protein n=1 Tax=Cylindrotheca closterium TaxID=2856 RepID=A0AAD2PXQ7_9STRA|nr:unnamed protein product [Cylindrotheca closterium]